MEFKLLKLEDKELFEKYKSYMPNLNPYSSVQNFSALYMWRESLGIEICELDDVLYLKRTKPPVFGFLPPLLKNKDDLEKAMENLKHHSEEENFPFQFIDVEKWFVDDLEKLDKDKISFFYKVLEDEDNSEYLYDSEKLRTLSGKKMHSKKNHYNGFIKEYDGRYEVRDLFKSKEDVIEMAKRWLVGRESKYTLGELEGIKDLLNYKDILNTKGIAIYIDGQCEGFTISEELGKDAVLVHIEKANDEINGLFTVVNTLNSRITHPESKITNREQDLGIEGLRKAKLSWKPIDMVTKYLVRVYDKKDLK